MFHSGEVGFLISEDSLHAFVAAYATLRLENAIPALI